MKLIYTPSDGYIHKVLAFAQEAGVLDRMEMVPVIPFAADVDISAINPLGKVPTLVTDQGEAIYGGPVICQYLDSLSPGPSLYPGPGPALWRTLTRITLAEGVFEAMVALSLESRFAPEQQRQGDVERAWRKVVKGLDRMEQDAAEPGPFDAAQIFTAGAVSFVEAVAANVGKALAGLDPAYDWRAGRPVLAAWYDQVKTRPSLRKVRIPPN
ncbi:MAG: glutathione S-transferase family protein [Alphaproteobacteria bacterium]